jgi:hypothetical protein
MALAGIVEAAAWRAKGVGESGMPNTEHSDAITARKGVLNQSGC